MCVVVVCGGSQEIICTIVCVCLFVFVGRVDGVCDRVDDRGCNFVGVCEMHVVLWSESLSVCMCVCLCV